MLSDMPFDPKRTFIPSEKALPPWAMSFGLAAAVGIIYFLAARLSLALISRPDGVAVFWPAAGVSSGVLIGLGSMARLPVIAGTAAATVIANLLGDRTIGSALVFALCNAGEAVIVAAIIQRFFGWPFRLESPAAAALGLVVTVGAVATGAYWGLKGLGNGIQDWTQYPVELWVGTTALVHVAAATLLYVGIWDRWPVPKPEAAPEVRVPEPEQLSARGNDRVVVR
jgi:hypothetical protein